jgi:hypothetical protein
MGLCFQFESFQSPRKLYVVGWSAEKALYFQLKWEKLIEKGGIAGSSCRGWRVKAGGGS